MASAEKTMIETVMEEEGLTLTLTMKEARALFALTMRVGGDPRKSPRELIDNIRFAIIEGLDVTRYDTDWAQPEYACFEHSKTPGITAANYDAT